MKTFTYSITHIPTGRIYYGVKKCDERVLGEHYLSSSKLIQRMIQDEGIHHFRFKERMLFESYEAAREFETKLLRRINAIRNPRVLNQAISSPRICSKDSVAEQARRVAISTKMKQLWQDPEYRNRQSFHLVSTEDRIERQKASVLQRAANLESGKTQRRIRKPKVYKDVILTKNGQTKTVKSNQVPAYRKCGWITR